MAREFRENARRFFLNYFKAAARAFPAAFAGRKYSIKSSTSLRAFIRIVPYVIAMVRKRGGDVWSAGELDAALRPWAEAIGDRRFETDTVWKEKLTGGTRSGRRDPGAGAAPGAERLSRLNSRARKCVIRGGGTRRYGRNRRLPRHPARRRRRSAPSGRSGATTTSISLRNQVANGWKQIDVQLKRRHDLIPNLVSAVKGEMQFEQDTLEKVIQARNSAVAARGVADAADKENALTQTLSRLFALAENYPTLKANEQVKTLMEELSSTENRIGFARQFYNDIATRFNTAQQVFPDNLIAQTFKFQPVELFEIQDAAERAVPKVDLSLRPPQ